MNWETVIGVEVHVETNTASKMFCACSANYFGAIPNTHTCPVCLGLPGALPYPNLEALEKCIKIGLALGCTINRKSLFERKNYFYPDLSKGYQISQYRWPLCVNGKIEVEGKFSKRTIRINRAHQEEDTGKLMHREGKTFIDFNRSGVPLVEIVTEADFRDSSEVRDYGKKLQQIIRSIGVSNADMEKGDMRLEANVSVRPEGQKELAPYRVELKNINSFKFIADAIDFEVRRQIILLENGEKIHQQTRGYNENKKETFLQRMKEEANDYRYFPEPDIPPFTCTEEQIKKIKSKMGGLPSQKQAQIESLGVEQQAAKALISNEEKTKIFLEAVAGISKDEAPALAKFFLNKASKAKTANELIGIYQAKKLQKSTQITSQKELSAIAREVILENTGIVKDYQSGKVNAVQVLVGKVMQKTQGRADAKEVKIILESLLK